MRFTRSEMKKMGENSTDSSVYSRGSNSLLSSFVSEKYQSSVFAYHGHKASFLKTCWIQGQHIISHIDTFHYKSDSNESNKLQRKYWQHVSSMPSN